MAWKPLSEDVPLDHEAAQPPQQAMGTAPATDGGGGFQPLPDDAQLDQQTPPAISITPDHFSAPEQVILADAPAVPQGQDTGIIGEKGGTHTEENPQLAGADAAVNAMLKSGAGNEKILGYLKKRGMSDAGLFDIAQQLAKIRTWQQQNPSYKGDFVVDLQHRQVPNSIGQNIMGSDVGAAMTAAGDASTAFALPKIAELAGADSEETQTAIQAAEAAHPKSALIGTITGGAAATLGLEEGLARTGVGGLARVAPEAAEGVAAFSPVIRPAAANALYGGATGAATADTGADGSPATALDRVLSGLEGAGVGAVASPVMHGVAKLPSAAVNTGRSVLQGSPGLAQRIIAKAIKQDMNTPESVGQTIAEAHANGVPMALGDTGENVRGLLAASSRSSGVGRTIVRDALEERQAGLADRITQHIERDLGPVANPHEVADELMTKARTEAAPLYDEAYAKPVPDAFVEKLKPLLQRPSVQKALNNARRIAQEEGDDPDALGLSVGSDGQTIVGAAPSWKTLDYIKRGMDDVVEGYRDKTSGKLVLDTEGRAVNNTLRSFINAIDSANPSYAEARAAYAGPVKGIAAMNLGRKALNMSADDLEARIRDMSPFEKTMFSAGTRRAMAETVQSKGDTADIVNALVGTGKKRAMLARAFGDRKQFQRFVDTLGQEKEGWRSLKQAMLGSPTAANVADDAALQAATMAADFATTGLPVATSIRYALKFGVGKLGEKAKQQIAALPSNTDPAAIRELAAELRAQAEKRGLHVRRVSTAGNAMTGAATAEIRQQQRQ
jgi:hypothetical protein